MTRLFSLLCITVCILGSTSCGDKGSTVRKNAHGVPSLAAPPTATGAAFVVPENLIPPGATPTKTKTGVSDRIYESKDRTSDVKTFFASAIPDANIESVREGEHVTVTGGGWVIELYGAEGAPTTIVYAKEKEL